MRWWAVIFLVFLSASVVGAQQGCCSWHGGVCGCRCCDGTPLSVTCAPHYPGCSSSTVSTTLQATTTTTMAPDSASNSTMQSLLSSTSPKIIEPIVLLANSIDGQSIEQLLQRLSRRGMVIRISGGEFQNYSRYPEIVVLGGPHAPEGVGDVVGALLTDSEQDSLMGSPNRSVKFVKHNLSNNIQSIEIYAGYEKEQTRQAWMDDIPEPETATLSIASWNLQVFGEKKASDPVLMNYYADKISQHDIVIIQEIRDSSGTAFQKLCSMLPSYQCTISSRLGPTVSKEQYGILYRKAELMATVDRVSLGYGQFARPPFSVYFSSGNWSFRVTTVHTDPDQAASEIKALDGLLASDDYVGDEVVLGDLNADCSYYRSPHSDLKTWDWVLPDSEDTTVAPTDCAYDRIILNEGAARHFVNYSIMRDVQKEQSDHYLISGVFSVA